MVRKVMEAVCVLLKEKNTWSSAKQLLGDPGLLKRLTYFDKDNIPLKVKMYIIYFKSRYIMTRFQCLCTLSFQKRQKTLETLETLETCHPLLYLT